MACGEAAGVRDGAVVVLQFQIWHAARDKLGTPGSHECDVGSNLRGQHTHTVSSACATHVSPPSHMPKSRRMFVSTVNRMVSVNRCVIAERVLLEGMHTCHFGWVKHRPSGTGA